MDDSQKESDKISAMGDQLNRAIGDLKAEISIMGDNNKELRSDIERLNHKIDLLIENVKFNKEP